MDKKEVSIYCELGFAIYSALPIVKFFKKNNYDIFLYTNSSNLNVSHNYLGIKKEKIYSIESVLNKYFVLLDYFLKELLISRNYSSQYNRYIGTRKGLIGFIGKTLSCFPKFKSKNVNGFYSSLWKMINSKPVFKTNKIIYISLTQSTYLLNSNYHKVFTIVESWDHISKSPIFHKPESIFLWNKSMTNDLYKFRNIAKSYTIFPFKFRYLVDNGEKLLDDHYLDDYNFIKNNRYILYTCTYSLFSGKKIFESELKLIKILLKYCNDNQIYLYVRQHPHSLGHEFNIFKNSNFLKIGKSIINKGFNKVFDDSDNNFKIELINNAEFMINVGTTIVLEGALCNQKIMQISFKKSPSYFGFFQASQNYHIDKYLNSREKVFFFNEKKSINKFYKKLSNLDYTFTDSLKSWLENDVSIEKSLDIIYKNVHENN